MRGVVLCRKEIPSHRVLPAALIFVRHHQMLFLVGVFLSAVHYTQLLKNKECQQPYICSLVPANNFIHINKQVGQALVCFSCILIFSMAKHSNINNTYFCRACSA